MTEPRNKSDIIPENQSLWGTNRQPVGCPYCHRVFLVRPSQLGIPCPLCIRGHLESQPARMRPVEPEKFLPFKVGKRQLSSIYESFISDVWIKPTDFTSENLLKRTMPVFWPLWLVDSDVDGHWQMEAGFNYEVESSKEIYAGGQWQSRRQIETRIQWETRLGEISRQIENVIAPALEEHENRKQMTADTHLDRAEDFDPDRTGSALLEVPDLPPEEAWPLAKPKVDQTAGEICVKAAGANHVRNFALKASYKNLNWTQLYLPLFATFYKDDDGQPRILIVNGETGSIQGPRLASPKRGLRIAGIIAAVAGALLLFALIGLLLISVFPPAGLIAALLGVLGFGMGISALIPAIWPGQWNRKQDSPQIAEKKK